MSIAQVGQYGLSAFKKTLPDSIVEKKEVRESLRNKVSSAPSRVSLSGTAADDVNPIKAFADQVPEIREDKINMVRERIASGYYNTPGLLEELSDKLADVL